jgi:hypothetical protein
MNQPFRDDLSEFTDSEGIVLLIAEGSGDTTVRPTDPRLREEIERRLHRQQTPPQQSPGDVPQPEEGPPSA